MCLQRKIPKAVNRLGVIAVVAFAAVSIPVPGAETSGGAAVSLLYGLDTNPLKIMGDGDDGMFSELLVSGGFNVGFGPTVGLFMDGDGGIRRYESGFADADTSGARARLGLSFAPLRGNPGRMAVAIGGTYGTNRSTFTDRVTGAPYEIVVDPVAIPPATAAIPDRFSANTTGGFVDFRWRPTRSFRVLFRTQLDKTDFIEDYTSTGVLYSLDNTIVTFEPGVQYQFNGIVAVTFSVAMTTLSYDEQPALDLDGSEVAGTTREYRHAEYRVKVLISPRRSMFLTVGIRGGDRQDTYAGYYDFNARTAFVTFDQTIGRRNSVQFNASLRQVDYDRAVVPGTIEEAIRSSEVQRYVGRYKYMVHKYVGLFAEGGVLRTDNRDPIFAFDRNWILTGVEFRR